MTDLSARVANPAVEKAISALPNLVKLGYRLLRDPRVPVKHKAFVGAALAYLVAPIDVIPDFIPFLGQADDVLLLAFALNAMFEAAGARANTAINTTTAINTHFFIMHLLGFE